MIQRTRSVERIDAMTRRLWLQVAEDGQPWASCAEFLADERNIALDCEAGVFLFAFHEPGTYEIHTLFGPGKGALACGMDALSWIFTHTDCVEVVTKVPQWNVGAKEIAERAGFELLYSGRSWKHGGKAWTMDFMRLEIQQWILAEGSLVARGERFHGQLSSLGIETDHEDDSVHDRYVGAALAMVEGGQIGKAVIYYNRWARLYGYHLISVESVQPLKIDIGTAVITVEGDRICL